MKKNILHFLVVLPLTFLLIACGSKEEGKTSPSNNQKQNGTIEETENTVENQPANQEEKVTDEHGGTGEEQSPLVEILMVEELEFPYGGGTIDPKGKLTNFTGRGINFETFFNEGIFYKVSTLETESTYSDTEGVIIHRKSSFSIYDGSSWNSDVVFEFDMKEPVKYHGNLVVLNPSEVAALQPEGTEIIHTTYRGNELYIFYVLKDVREPFIEYRDHFLSIEDKEEMGTFWIHKVVFDQSGSLTFNDIIYEGEYFPFNFQNTVLTSKGIAMYEYVPQEDESMLINFRFLNDYNTVIPVHDKYSISYFMDFKQIAYVDFDKNLTYIGEKDIKILDNASGEPIYENGKDKVIDMGLNQNKFVHFDPEQNLLYSLGRGSVSLFDLTTGTVAQNLKIDFYSDYSIEEDGIYFWKTEEYERKPVLKAFKVPFIGTELQ